MMADLGIFRVHVMSTHTAYTTTSYKPCYKEVVVYVVYSLETPDNKHPE